MIFNDKMVFVRSKQVKHCTCDRSRIDLPAIIVVGFIVVTAIYPIYKKIKKEKKNISNEKHNFENEIKFVN